MANFRNVGMAPGELICWAFCGYVVFVASRAGTSGNHSNFSAMNMTRDEVYAARDTFLNLPGGTGSTGVSSWEIPSFLRQLGVTPAYEAYYLTGGPGAGYATATALRSRINALYRLRPGTPGIIVPTLHRGSGGICTDYGHVVVVWLGDQPDMYWVYDPNPLPGVPDPADHLSQMPQVDFAQRAAGTACARGIIHPYLSPSELRALPL